MNRKDFLSLLGLGSTSVVMASCLGGCAKSVSEGTTAPTGVDFTLDLTQSANAALTTNGGYLFNNGVLVARTITGAYIAVQQMCTHESVRLVFQGNSHRFYCDGHGATFTENGTVTGGPAPRALTTYNTSLTGNLLRVYS